MIQFWFSPFTKRETDPEVKQHAPGCKLNSVRDLGYNLLKIVQKYSKIKKSACKHLNSKFWRVKTPFKQNIQGNIENQQLIMISLIRFVVWQKGSEEVC